MSDNGGQNAFNGGFVQLGCNSKDKPVLTPALEIDGSLQRSFGNDDSNVAT